MDPALHYAENVLGVHAVYQEARDLREALDNELTALDKAQDDRRVCDEQIAEREADLLIEERGKHADASANWLEQHMRTVKQKDPVLRSFRGARSNAQAGFQGNEINIRALEWQLKISIARMTELGGYFQYLAAVKLGAIQAEKTTQPTPPGEST